MSKNKQVVASHIKEEVDLFNQSKTKRKSGISKEEFDKLGIELNPKQEQLYKGIKSNILNIVHGPAGSGKTFVACYAALSLLANKKVERIILSKSNVESGLSGMGFLPGPIEEKYFPFVKSYITTFEKIIGKQATSFLISNNEIVMEPLTYMRGSTYDNCVMILDESQNTTMKELMLWSTRLGKDSKAIMLGDVSQYDVKKSQSGYNDFIKMTSGMEDLFTFEFDNSDIVRNKFLIELTNRYDQYRLEEGI
jgi:phosphate starvation-inducible protein PhoH and related proteins